MRAARWLSAYLAASCLLISLGACGLGEEPAASPKRIQQAKIQLPSQILGLKVGREDISGRLSVVKNPYLENIGLFSLREQDDLLRATFQFGLFSPVAREESDRFRRSIIGLIGSSTPQQIRVQSTIVYMTTGNQQNVFAWFRGRGFYVLTTHQGYPFPRTLLRRMISLEGEE